ncbi:unannotated protein [freshwater metagenome]|uniref:Unannotated protein n=1 Tax=freshwater metagenome TaxID=449393 RepID=A0A6J6IWV8_9ZZZZ
MPQEKAALVHLRARKPRAQIHLDYWLFNKMARHPKPIHKGV